MGSLFLIKISEHQNEENVLLPQQRNRNTSSVFIFLGDSSLWGDDVLFTPATGLVTLVAVFPEGLCGWLTRRVEETTLEMVGFGGGEMAGCVAV